MAAKKDKTSENGIKYVINVTNWTAIINFRFPGY